MNPAEIYIKSNGYSNKPFKSMLKINDTEISIRNRGINIFCIDTNYNFSYHSFDTYLHNLENPITEHLFDNYKNPDIKLIILIIHDEATRSTSLTSLSNQLQFLNVKLLEHLNFRWSYYFVYNNNTKCMIKENVNSNCIQEQFKFDSSSIEPRIYLCCCEKIYRYFEDYVNTLMDNLSIGIVTINNLNNYKYNEKSVTYIFCQSIPQAVLINSNISKLLLNTEQLSQPVFLNYCKLILSLNIRVIDYNKENLRLVNNTNTLYLPYQFHQEEIDRLQYHITNKNVVYDVVMTPIVTEKRMFIFNKLLEKNIKIAVIGGWRDDRDKEIATGKILLNIHHDQSRNVFENFRCDRWIMSGMPIISESSINEKDIDVADLIVFENYNNIINKVVEILDDYDNFYNEFKTKYDSLIPIIKEQRTCDLKDFIKKLNQ